MIRFPCHPVANSKGNLEKLTWFSAMRTKGCLRLRLLRHNLLHPRITVHLEPSWLPRAICGCWQLQSNYRDTESWTECLCTRQGMSGWTNWFRGHVVPWHSPLARVQTHHPGSWYLTSKSLSMWSIQQLELHGARITAEKRKKEQEYWTCLRRPGEDLGCDTVFCTQNRQLNYRQQ